MKDIARLFVVMMAITASSVTWAQSNLGTPVVSSPANKITLTSLPDGRVVVGGAGEKLMALSTTHFCTNNATTVKFTVNGVEFTVTRKGDRLTTNNHSVALNCPLPIGWENFRAKWESRRQELEEEEKHHGSSEFSDEFSDKHYQKVVNKLNLKKAQRLLTGSLIERWERGSDLESVKRAIIANAGDEKVPQIWATIVQVGRVLYIVTASKNLWHLHPTRPADKDSSSTSASPKVAEESVVTATKKKAKAEPSSSSSEFNVLMYAFKGGHPLRWRSRSKNKNHEEIQSAINSVIDLYKGEEIEAVADECGRWYFWNLGGKADFWNAVSSIREIRIDGPRQYSYFPAKFSEGGNPPRMNNKSSSSRRASPISPRARPVAFIPPRTAAARAWSQTPGLTTTKRVLTASTGA